MGFRFRQALRERLRDDRGASIIVVFLVFFPLFLLSLALLVEASRMQALKNENDIVTHIAANAAVRQADYEGLAAGTADQIRLLHPSAAGDPLMGFADYDNPDTVRSLFSDTASSVLLDNSSSGLDSIDRIDAETLARLVYHANANLNGLNTAVVGSIGGVTASPDGEVQVGVTNPTAGNTWGYYNQVLGRNVQASYPGVELETRVLYSPTSLLVYLSGGQTGQLGISSQAVSQVVPGRAAAR